MCLNFHPDQSPHTSKSKGGHFCHKNVGKDQNIGKLTTNLFKTRGTGMCGKIGILKIDTNFWSRRKTIIGKLGKVRKM